MGQINKLRLGLFWHFPSVKQMLCCCLHRALGGRSMRKKQKWRTKMPQKVQRTLSDTEQDFKGWNLVSRSQIKSPISCVRPQASYLYLLKLRLFYKSRITIWRTPVPSSVLRTDNITQLPSLQRTAPGQTIVILSRKLQNLPQILPQSQSRSGTHWHRSTRNQPSCLKVGTTLCCDSCPRTPTPMVGPGWGSSRAQVPA